MANQENNIDRRTLLKIGVGAVGGAVIESATGVISKAVDILTKRPDWAEPVRQEVSKELAALNQVTPKYPDFVDELKDHYSYTLYAQMVERARWSQSWGLETIQLTDPQADFSSYGGFNLVGVLPSLKRVETPRILDLVDAILAQERTNAYMAAANTGRLVKEPKIDSRKFLEESFRDRDQHALVMIFQPKNESIDNPRTARIHIYADPEYLYFKTEPAGLFDEFGARTAFLTTSESATRGITQALWDSGCHYDYQCQGKDKYGKSYQQMLYERAKDAGLYTILPGNRIR